MKNSDDDLIRIAPRKLNPKTRLLGEMHETAGDMFRLGFIDTKTMRDYDALCLEPVPPFDAAKIKAVRESCQISQAVLASVLNTSLSAVRQWEIGKKRPGGASQKLLYLIEKRGLEAVL